MLKLKIILLSLFLIGSCNKRANSIIKNKKTNKNHQLVIFIHGINETSKAFEAYESFMQEKGYDTLALDYDSTNQDIASSVKEISKKINLLVNFRLYNEVHIIAHSMGGIITYFLINDYNFRVNSVVMLASPLKGAQVARYYYDSLLWKYIYLFIYGKAGKELIPESDLIKSIKKITYSAGIIKGNLPKGVFLNSKIMKNQANDGMITLDEAENEGILDSIILTEDHISLLESEKAFKQTLHFFKFKKFEK